ncbi:MAG: ABC transporter ATP-binding protein [Eubacteriales bacterium]|nr:ABC transporter ATP-binding protein [Eubacteriales bacterium]
MKQYKEFAMQKLLSNNISSFKKKETAAYLSALTNDVTSVEQNYLSDKLFAISLSFMFFATLIMMLVYSPLLTLISLLSVALPLLASVLSGNKVQLVEKKVSEENKNFVSVLNDILGGFAVIKNFKAEAQMLKILFKKNEDLEYKKFDRRSIQLKVQMLSQLSGLIAQFSVFVFGTAMVLKGMGITSGTVMAFVNLMNSIIKPIAEMPAIIANQKAAKALISKTADILSGQGNEKPTGEHISLYEGITVKNLSFAYEENRPVLKDISLKFEKGKSYAIIGSSGSGKSTLLNLLMGTDDNYTGDILYDTKEVSSINKDLLYELIAVIQQNVFIFNASIVDNITMFQDFDKDKVMAVAEKAQLKELILERGENYMCGENGKELSGGEKQRISIARSLIKNASVLFADEITAALDAKTSFEIINDILKLEDITRIVVTHSLERSLLEKYDEIIVLKDGKVEETGTFKELIEKRGYFNALYTISQ